MAKNIKRMADGGSADVKDSGGSSKLNLKDVLFGGLARPIWETIGSGNFGVPGLIKLMGQKEEDKKKPVIPGAPAPVRPTMRKGGAVKTYAKGGSVKSSASKRADGIAQKGKTRGKLV